MNSWNKRFLTEADWGQAQKLLAVGIDRSSMEKGYLRAGGDLVWVNLTESLLRAAAGYTGEFHRRGRGDLRAEAVR